MVDRGWGGGRAATACSRAGLRSDQQGHGVKVISSMLSGNTFCQVSGRLFTHSGQHSFLGQGGLHGVQRLCQNLEERQHKKCKQCCRHAAGARELMGPHAGKCRHDKAGKHAMQCNACHSAHDQSQHRRYRFRRCRARACDMGGRGRGRVHDGRWGRRPGGRGMYRGPWHMRGSLGQAAIMEQVLWLHNL